MKTKVNFDAILKINSFPLMAESEAQTSSFNFYRVTYVTDTSSSQ